MPQQRWETQSGLPTLALMYEQLTEHLILAQENCLMLSHLVNTEDGVKDAALSKGWQAVAERLRVMQAMVTSMAQGRLQ
jgi:hypothetical protein